jgi:hypothetical protein
MNLDSTARLHRRFRKLVARAIVKSDAEEAAHLAGLRKLRRKDARGESKDTTPRRGPGANRLYGARG